LLSDPLLRETGVESRYQGETPLLLLLLQAVKKYMSAI